MNEIPDHVQRLQARPDILAAIRHAQEHPEESVTLTLPEATDLDWETP
jgi:hypothetical protein